MPATDRKKAGRDDALKHHLHALGLHDEAAYRRWCGRHGFATKRSKSGLERRRERLYAAELTADLHLKVRKRDGRADFSAYDPVISGCRPAAGDAALSLTHRLVHGGGRIVCSRHQDSLRRLFRAVVDLRPQLLSVEPAHRAFGVTDSNTTVGGLVRLAARQRHWLREPAHWRPVGRQPAKAFASLLRHLLADYPLPPFFDSAWFDPDEKADRARRWCVRVAAGESLRRCDLPIACTRRMVHETMKAPGTLTVPAALRWGQLRALGVGKAHVRAVLATRLRDAFGTPDREAFWCDLFRWLAAHPEMPCGQVGPAVDFLDRRRHGIDHDPQGHELPPPQPHLSMAGRTPESLLRQMEGWHRRLAVDDGVQAAQWEPCGLSGVTIRSDGAGVIPGGQWTVRELVCSKDLVAEGRRLNHCVASYVRRCRTGASAIFTVERTRGDRVRKLLTAEVDPAHGTIVQVRGRSNRDARPGEMAVLRRWATVRGLSLASHLDGTP